MRSSKGVLYFLLINFGMTWLSVLIVWASGVSAPNDASTLLDYARFLLIVVPISFGPAIAGFVTRKWITREGFGDAGLGLSFRTNWGYCVLAWLFPFAVVALIALLSLLAGLGVPDGSRLTAMVLIQPLVLAVITTPYVLGEEFGWRGYLQLHLFGERPAMAAVATGLIHGVWHYPMILTGMLATELPLTVALLGYPIMTIGGAFIYGWFMSRTRSIWVASLAHSSSNSLVSTLIVLLFPDKADYVGRWFLRLLSLGLLISGAYLIGLLRRGVGSRTARRGMETSPE